MLDQSPRRLHAHRERTAGRAAVYLARDRRDVPISLAHHNSTTIDDAVKLMNAADGALCHGRKNIATQFRLQGWSGHAKNWHAEHPFC